MTLIDGTVVPKCQRADARNLDIMVLYWYDLIIIPKRSIIYEYKKNCHYSSQGYSYDD